MEEFWWAPSWCLSWELRRWSWGRKTEWLQYSPLPSQRQRAQQPAYVGRPLPSLESLTFSCHFHKWDGLIVALSFSLLIILHGGEVGAGDRALRIGTNVRHPRQTSNTKHLTRTATLPPGKLGWVLSIDVGVCTHVSLPRYFGWPENPLPFLPSLPEESSTSSWRWRDNTLECEIRLHNTELSLECCGEKKIWPRLVQHFQCMLCNGNRNPNVTPGAAPCWPH